MTKRDQAAGRHQSQLETALNGLRAWALGQRSGETLKHGPSSPRLSAAVDVWNKVLNQIDVHLIEVEKGGRHGE